MLCKNAFHDRWMKGCQVSPFYESNSWIICINSLWLKLSRLQPQISSNILNYLQFNVYFRALKMDQMIKVLATQCEVLSLITRTHTTQGKNQLLCLILYLLHVCYGIQGHPLHTQTRIFKINKCKYIHFIAYRTHTSFIRIKLSFQTYLLLSAQAQCHKVKHSKCYI